jgi:hypothetical protein
MFRQLIEMTRLEPEPSTDKPAGKDGASEADFMRKSTPSLSDLATRCTWKTYSEPPEREMAGE